jgi:hypothetical protein
MRTTSFSLLFHGPGRAIRSLPTHIIMFHDPTVPQLISRSRLLARRGGLNAALFGTWLDGSMDDGSPPRMDHMHQLIPSPKALVEMDPSSGGGDGL